VSLLARVCAGSEGKRKAKSTLCYFCFTSPRRHFLRLFHFFSDDDAIVADEAIEEDGERGVRGKSPFLPSKEEEEEEEKGDVAEKGDLEAFEEGLEKREEGEGVRERGGRREGGREKEREQRVDFRSAISA
jgi:hypothetical protein